MSFRDSSTGQYPVSHEQIRRFRPNSSFPAYFESAEGYDWVNSSDRPAYNPDTQYLEESDPQLVDNGWYQTWVIKEFTEEEIASRLSVKTKALMSDVVTSTQQRLDDFAKTRNYDGILSACTYATSPTTKFATEGQYCVEARDATWATLYTIMAEVEAGTRPMPSSFADIEPDLPVLVWPSI